MKIDWETAKWRTGSPEDDEPTVSDENGHTICICETDEQAQAIAGLPELVRAARRVAKAAAAAVRIGVNVSPSKTNRVLRAALAPYER